MNSPHLFKLSSLAAAAGLGFGLLVAGCGDSGSTTPSPVEKNFNVTYEYSAAPAARALLTADITEVHYDFLDASNKFVSDTDMIAIEHTTTAKNKDVTVRDLKEGITSSVAYYFNDDEEIVALGYDTFNFDTTGKAKVTAPVVDTDYAAHITDMTAVPSPETINIDESSQVTVSANYTVADKTVALDLTRHGLFVVDKTDILTPDAKTPGLFTSKAYGKATITFVPALTMALGFINPTCTINVTDAELTAVEIRYNDNQNSMLNFLIPDYNFGVGNVVFKDVAINATDNTATDMYLVAMYSSETEGVTPYEEVITEGIEWSIEGLTAADPELEGVAGPNGVYTVTAKKPVISPEDVYPTVKAQYTMPGSKVYSDTLQVSVTEVQAKVSFEMVMKTIDDVLYPTPGLNIPCGQAVDWVVNANGNYKIADKYSNTFAVATIIDNITEVVTVDADVPGVTLKLDKSANAFNLAVPRYYKESIPTAYEVTVKAQLVKDASPATASWHAVIVD